MKAPLFALLTLLLTAPLMAQDKELPGNFHDEIGLNFTRFLDEAVDFGGENTLLSPYLFTYQRLNEKGDGFRLGAGLEVARTKGDITGNFFDDDAKSSSFRLDLRLGNQHVRALTNRWHYYYGFDGLLGLSFLTVESDNTDIDNQGIYAGIGPVLGTRFMISDRVGLFTEASFYLTQSFNSERINFDNTFEQDERNKANTTSLSFTVPTNIYLFFKF